MIFVFGRDYLILTKMTFLTLWFIQFAGLVYYVNNTNWSLTRFLLSLQYNDHIVQPAENKTFKRLNLTYNQIIDRIKKNQIEKETKQQFYQYILEEAETGLVAFYKHGIHKGKVEVINHAALELLSLPVLKNIRDLNDQDPGTEIINLMFSLETGKQRVLNMTSEGKAKRILIRMKDVMVEKELLRIVSLQNIQHELEEEEILTWMKLSKVMNHEISNSISPVASLSNALIKILEPINDMDNDISLNNKKLNDLKLGLEAIQNRSVGLLHFVEKFRLLQTVPKPQISPVVAKEMISRLIVLFNQQIEFYKVKVHVSGDNKLLVRVDEKLFMQVLINLLRNAIHAVKDRHEKEIWINYSMKGSLHEIEIRDNGPGISAGEQENIFIPFYSGMEGGSGIGLSLSRQIVFLHKGSLDVQSVTGQGASFTVRLPS